MEKKRLSLLIGLMLVLSAFLSACGGGGDSADSDKDGDAKDVAQHLRININTEPPSLNPQLAEDSTSGTVLRQTFEGLTRIGMNDEPEMAMAEDVEISEDQKTYTFKLRDAQWSNGDPVTAQDFEYAWKWALDPNNQSTYAYQLYYIEGAEAAHKGEGSLDDVGVKAIDDKTLEVKLVNPTPYFLELVAFYTYLPVNHKVAQENPDWAADAGENFVTNGPFHLVEWSHSDTIVLEKSDTYWDKDNVKLEKIEMYMINDPNTELSMFDNGELDWAGKPTGELPTDAMQALKDEGRLNTQAIAGIYNYKLNTTVEPFNNENFRKALSLSINRQELIDNILQGEQLPAMAIVPPTMIEDNEKGYYADNDVEAAKQHLDKALEELGYKDVSELPEIKITYNTLESHQKIAQAIQDMWVKNLGIEVTLENAEWNVFLDTVNNMDFQIARMGWLGDFNDPMNFLEMYYDADGGNNNTGWENEEFQKLLDQSQTETDPEKRLGLLKQAEEIIVNEMPIIPIYFYTNNWVQAENLKDVHVSGLGDVQFKWAHFE